MWLQGQPAGECGEVMLVVNEKRERKHACKEVMPCKCVWLSDLVVVVVVMYCQMHSLKVNKINKCKREWRSDTRTLRSSSSLMLGRLSLDSFAIVCQSGGGLNAKEYGRKIVCFAAC